MEESIKTFREENLYITYYSNLIAIKAFRKELSRSSNLFVELTKTIPLTMEETYKEARDFINLELELRLSDAQK